MPKEKYKIVYIGAGSFRFTVPLAMNILDFARDFHPVELWLVDIDVKALKLMYGLIRKMIIFHKKDITLHMTTDRKKALPDTDYVLISISVGTQYSEWFDIHLPLKFGMPQNTGDTVGPGGIMRGIRTIPVMIDFYRDINDLCPNATVISYTNPQGTLMLAANQAASKVQSIGLCHEILYLKAKWFGKFNRYMRDAGIDISTNKEFKLLYGGLNHFAWITKIEYDGEDIYPKLRAHAEYGYTSHKYHRPYNYYLLQKTGYFTYVEDRHVTEFIPKYYNYFNYKKNPFGIKLRDVRGIHKQRLFVYKAINWGQKYRNSWFIWMFLRPMEGGEKALLMAKDKERNEPKQHVCNVLNNGTIPSLPDNCVVEIPCYFKDDKLIPSKVGPLPKLINDLVLIHAKNQQPVVDAALSGDPEDILKAFLGDSMCAFIEDEEKIEAMINNMLYYESKWLPNFSESIPSLEEIKKSKYFIDFKELCTYERARTVKFPPDLSLKAKAWPQVE